MSAIEQTTIPAAALIALTVADVSADEITGWREAVADKRVTMRMGFRMVLTGPMLKGVAIIESRMRGTRGYHATHFEKGWYFASVADRDAVFAKLFEVSK